MVIDVERDRHVAQVAYRRNLLAPPRTRPLEPGRRPRRPGWRPSPLWTPSRRELWTPRNAITVDHASIGTPGFADPSTTTIAFTTNVTIPAGAFIVVSVGWFNAVTLSSVSGGGLTWTIDKQGHPTTPALSNSAIVSAQAPSGLASSTTITATFSAGAVARNIAGTSFTGIATSSPVDGTPPATTGGVTTSGWASSSATILAGSMLIACAYNETNNFTNTPTSPSVQDVIVANTASGVSSVTCHRIEASAGPYAVAGTWSGTANTAINVVPYLAAAGGGGGASSLAFQSRIARNTNLRR